MNYYIVEVEFIVIIIDIGEVVEGDIVNFICIFIGIIIFICFFFMIYFYLDDVFKYFVNLILNLVIEYNNNIKNYYIMIFIVLNVYIDC